LRLWILNFINHFFLYRIIACIKFLILLNIRWLSWSWEIWSFLIHSLRGKRSRNFLSYLIELIYKFFSLFTTSYRGLNRKIALRFDVILLALVSRAFPKIFASKNYITLFPRPIEYLNIFLFHSTNTIYI